MEISSSQWIDLYVDVEEVYDAMSESEISELIELLKEGGHLTDLDTPSSKCDTVKTQTQIEWENILIDLMRPNTLLLITDTEYEQIKAIHSRIK
jgi:hypothetical protein